MKPADPSLWLTQLVKRVGWQKACVAMANKNAQILWAVMTREPGIDAKHLSAKPLGKVALPKAQMQVKPVKQVTQVDQCGQSAGSAASGAA